MNTPVQKIKPNTDPKRALASLAFWFWTLTILRFAFALLFFRDNPATATGVGSALSVAFAYLLVMWRLRTNTDLPSREWPPIVKWIAVYVVWCAISLFWTRSSSVISAVGYWITMTLDLFIVAALLKWGETEAVVAASLKGIVAGCGSITLTALLFTRSSDGRLGDVDFLHPTSVGNFASIGALCSFYFWFKTRAQASRERGYWAGSALFMVWILTLSVSKTSMIALVVAFSFFLLSSTGIPFKTKLGVLLMSVVLFGTMYGSVSGSIDDYEDNAKAVNTLTGRTVLWARAWEMIQDQPVIGYGFLSFRDYGPQDWSVRTSHGHNEWITQWFQLGAIGVLLTLAVYLSYFWCFWRSPKSPQRQLGLSLLIYMLIEGLTIADSYGLMFPLTMMLLLNVWTNTFKGPAVEGFRSTNSGRLPSLLRQPSC